MEKFSLDLAYGKVDGMYYRPENTSGSPLVVLVPGHNGFYSQAMLSSLQEKMLEKGIASICFNFSHGGIEGDNDVFTRIDLYEKNCMRLETEDVIGIIEHLDTLGANHEKLFIASHSLGSIPAVFGAKELLRRGKVIDGIILIAPSMTVDFWTDEQKKEWKENGVIFWKNNRTGQDLPQGKEFYEEVLRAHDEWSLEKALAETKTKYSIIHGDKDESVPFAEAEAIQLWNEKCGNPSKLIVIPGGSHAFGTKHPLVRDTEHLREVIDHIADFVL